MRRLAVTGRGALVRLMAAAGVAAVVLALPLFISDRPRLNVLTSVGINVLIVIGLSLLFGYGGQISLGHAAFFGLGAYTCAILTGTFGWPWLAAAPAAIAAAAASGLALAVPSLRLRGHYLAMATLGFGEIALIGFTTLSITGGTDGLRIGDASIGPLNVGTPSANYVLVWLVVIVTYVLARNVIASRPGRALRALHGSEAGAAACGIDISRTKVQVFTVSAALAGLAGALYASRAGLISPESFNLGFSISLVAMVALGGMGSLPGAVLAAAGLTLLPFIDALLPGLPPTAVSFLQEYNADIYGLVLILVMLFMPGGLAGAFRRLARRVQGRAESGGGA